MTEKQYNEIVAMLAVLYKKIDKLENKANGQTRIASLHTYLDEIKKEAKEIIDFI